MPRMYVGGTGAIDASLGLRRHWLDARCSAFTHLLLAARARALLAGTVAREQQLGGRSNADRPRRTSPSRAVVRCMTNTAREHATCDNDHSAASELPSR